MPATPGRSSPARPRHRPPHLPPKNGLDGWSHHRIPNELEELGISAITVNLMANSRIDLKPAPGTIPTTWQGMTYHIRPWLLAEYDKSFREALRHGATVSVVLLLSNPAKSRSPVARLMGHPDAVKEGVFAMPNVTSAEGIGIYGAVINFIAERWSRADVKHGRVHHWIIQNEIDAGWVWTNAGAKPAVVYMDTYQRSMRLTDLIARQYDPNSKPFISLTHHWVEAGDKKFYGSKRMRELLEAFTRAERDYPWALAHHPYPQNLRNPRAWKDSSATFSFDNLKITPKYIEVLDAWMKRPGMIYQVKVRPVNLSKNGFNSPDYSAKALEDQAAGMAMVWKKNLPPVVHRVTAIPQLDRQPQGRQSAPRPAEVSRRLRRSSRQETPLASLPSPRHLARRPHVRALPQDTRYLLMGRHHSPGDIPLNAFLYLCHG